MNPNNVSVCIVIVNWNGWANSIECLESLFHLEFSDYQIIISDNGSTDSSIHQIKAWADGKLNIIGSMNHQIRRLTFPPIPKPLFYSVINEDFRVIEGCEPSEANLLILSSKNNRGFAGGNNLAIRYAQKMGEFDFFWLLNNDTVVEPDALTNLLECLNKDSSAGICGSTLLYYDNPKIVQAYGGFRYNKWTGFSTRIGENEIWRQLTSVEEQTIEKSLYGIQGASMLVKSDLIKKVGLMAEDYFLYFEEQDWAKRSKNDFTFKFSSKSIVYHHEGGTTGASGRKPKEKNAISDYYGIRNRLKFTNKYHKEALFTVYLSLVFTIINRIRRKQWDRIVPIFKIILGYDKYFLPTTQSRK